MSLLYGNTGSSLVNRRDFLAGLDIDCRDLVCAKQVHASRIACVTESHRGCGALTCESAVPDTDAFVTNSVNVPVAVLTADCLSVFIYAPGIRVLGLVHAGWRSSKDEICAKTIHVMQEKFGADPADMHAVLGPCLRACCYEVGEEFNGYFPAETRSRQGKYYLDLAGVNKKQLIAGGIGEARIVDTGICTSCQNDEFFSFRREGKEAGRMMSVMMLK
jgi:YfiH family protein